jgi:hypothetical protein
MLWNANENGEPEKALRSRISEAMHWLVFYLMKVGKFGSLRTSLMTMYCVNPVCFVFPKLKIVLVKFLAIKFLKEADLSEPKLVRVSGYNSVVTKLGGNTVTLLGSGYTCVRRTQERVGRSGYKSALSVKRQPQNSDRFPSRIYGARGVWETLGRGLGSVLSLD